MGGEGAQNDVEAGRSLLDGGFGEAGDLEKAAGDGGISRGVEGGGGFWLIGDEFGAGIEVGGGADGDCDVVKGALGFDDAAPEEGGAGFSEGGDFVGELAAISAGFEGGDGVALKHEAGAEIQDYCEKGECCANSTARAFAAGANFFGDEAGEQREKDRGEENSEDPEVERGEPVECETARRERPKELDAGGLGNVEG